MNEWLTHQRLPSPLEGEQVRFLVVMPSLKSLEAFITRMGLSTENTRVPLGTQAQK